MQNTSSDFPQGCIQHVQATTRADAAAREPLPFCHRGTRCLALVLSTLAAIQSANAVPSFEPFADATASGGTSYAIGSNLAGQYNSTLFGPWYIRGTNFGSTQPTIAAGNLAYPAFPPSAGNCVLFGPDPVTNSMSACIDLNLTAGHTDTVYYSFLLKITDLSAVPNYPTNNPLAAFLDDPSLTFSANQIGRLGSRLVSKRVGDGYVLGISRSANTADFVYEPDGAAHTTNEVLLVVGCYQREAGVQTNINLWVNPPASSFGSNQPPPPTLVATSGNSALNNNSARAFGILCQFPSEPRGLIDDVRVAINDWAFVSGGDPAILVQPVSQTLPAGATASFTVTARGTPTLTYQWYKDGTTPLSDGGSVSGATTTNLTISNISSSDAGDYTVTVMNGLGNTVTSFSARLALTDPQITGQPQSRTNNYGTTATFQVTATGTGPLRYQWRKEGVGDLTDGGNILGSRSNVLAISTVALADAGTYSVIVSNGLGVTAESAPAQLTVLDPYFVTQPVSVTNYAGSNVSFHVVVNGSGAPSFTYQWLTNGVLIFDNAKYSGVNTDTLTVSEISAADQVNYSIVVIGASTVTSDSATLTVLSPVTITAKLAPRTVPPGSRVSFAVGAAGTGPLNYQWQLNGTNIPGATTAGYALAAAQASDAGLYSVIVSNSFSAATGGPVALTVTGSLQLYETNLVVIRVGEGNLGLSVNGSPLSLDQFTPGGSYVNTVAIPNDGPSGLVAIGWDNINGVNSGSTTGSCLTRSRDGRFLVVAGYHTNLNYGASLAGSLAAEVPRGIGLVDSFGQYTMPVASADAAFDQTYWRAAITDGTNNYWGAGGKSGVYYFGFDAPAAVVQNAWPNLRSLALFNGDIYGAGAVNGLNGVLKLDGMPTTAATTTNILFAGSSGTFDLMVSPDGNLIYVADQRAVGNNGGLQRWHFNGSTWTLDYTLTTGFGNLGPRYVTGDFSGPNPILYVTSNDQTFDNNRLIRVEDTGAGSAGVTLAYAGLNQTFRGLHFGPVPNTVLPRPTLLFTRSGNNLILSWSGPFTLISATNVTGPYQDVPSQSNPYTNNVNSPAQRYFGLRQ
jgi:hypothetical protein